MSAHGYFASAIVMGLILLALAGVFGRLGWRRDAGPGWERSRSARAMESPFVWTVGFLALAFGSGAGVVLALGGVDVPAGTQRMAVGALIGTLAALLGGFLAFSTYRSARFRGLNRAQAVATGVWIVGSLLVLAVLVKLLTTG